MRSLLEEAIQEHFGERCPDFEPGCPCCRAWAEFDEIERLRAALSGVLREWDEYRSDGRNGDVPFILAVTMAGIARAALAGEEVK